jgi:hypothetical protein
MLPTPPCYLTRYQRSRAAQGYQVKVLMQLHGAGDALRAPYYCGLRRGTTTPIPAPSPSCRRAAGAHLARHAPPSGIAVLKIRRPFPSRTLALRPHTSLFLLPALLQRQFWSWPCFSVDFPKPILTHIAPPLPSPHPPAPSPRTIHHPLSTPLPSCSLGPGSTLALLHPATPPALFSSPLRNFRPLPRPQIQSSPFLALPPRPLPPLMYFDSTPGSAPTSAMPIYHDPAHIRPRTRRSSTRRSFVSPLSRSASQMDQPRTLCPKDGDAFSFSPSHLRTWYAPRDLWDRLPAQLQINLSAVQHAGASVLTGMYPFTHVSPRRRVPLAACRAICSTPAMTAYTIGC